MSATAIAYMVGSMVVIWGSLIAALVFLRKRPERAEYPPEGENFQED